MRNIYNNFAGKSVERLAALSDGIFAVAMTLLVLELHRPDQSTMKVNFGTPRPNWLHISWSIL